MKKAVQAKHVPEVPILRFLAAQTRPATHWRREPDVVMASITSDVPELGDFPEKVLVAKLDAMARRDLVDGCACGCRGDWEITERGREELAKR